MWGSPGWNGYGSLELLTTSFAISTVLTVLAPVLFQELFLMRHTSQKPEAFRNIQFDKVPLIIANKKLPVSRDISR